MGGCCGVSTNTSSLLVTLLSSFVRILFSDATADSILPLIKKVGSSPVRIRSPDGESAACASRVEKPNPIGDDHKWRQQNNNGHSEGRRTDVTVSPCFRPRPVGKVTKKQHILEDLSANGPLGTARWSAEPPVGPGGCLVQVARRDKGSVSTLAPIEVWRLHGGGTQKCEPLRKQRCQESLGRAGPARSACVTELSTVEQTAKFGVCRDPEEASVCAASRPWVRAWKVHPQQSRRACRVTACCNNGWLCHHLSGVCHCSLCLHVCKRQWMSLY